MSESTRPTSNLAKNGNKSKPLLYDGFLELKHLTHYLPYELKVLSNDNIIFRLDGLMLSYAILFNENIESHWDYFSGFKPILRPLEDFRDDDYNFIYEDETDYESLCLCFLDLDVESRLTTKFSFIFWKELFENHFDLIEKGLAISIHDVEQVIA